MSDRDYSWSPQFRLGQEYRRRGAGLSQCPYIVSGTGVTWHIEAWKQGWRAADRELGEAR